MKNLIRHLSAYLAALLIFPILAGCASEGVTLAMNGPPQVRTDIFPGNDWSYSAGDSQSYENFSDVMIAQSFYGFWADARNWTNITPSRMASVSRGPMQVYYPLSVRWKLKDGREFILENIDVRGISNEYLRKNPIKLQWQREGRKSRMVIIRPC